MDDEWLFRKQEEEPIEPRSKLPEYRQWEKAAPRDGVSNLGTAAHRLIDALGLTERFREQQAVIRWPQVVGEKIARISEAMSIADGVLTVKVNSAAWRQELHYLKLSIIKSLNYDLRKEVVRDIKFV